MENIIKIKRGSGAPVSLEYGELGYDSAAQSLYVGDSGNTPISLCSQYQNNYIAEANSEDGEKYTLEIPGLRELKPGMIITIIPQTKSTSTYPTLKINEGEEIPLFLGTNCNAASALNLLKVNGFLPGLPEEEWLWPQVPITLQLQSGILEQKAWVTVSYHYSNVSYAEGVLEIEHGGTGANTTEGARENLKIPLLADSDSITWENFEIGEEASSTEENSEEMTLSPGIYYKPHVDMGYLLAEDQTDQLLKKIERKMLDKIYPIGSIYMSVNSTSPAELFGGRWEPLKDRFLLGAGETYEAGKMDGEATHKLTISEMPKHYHDLAGSVVYWVDGTGDVSGATSGKYGKYTTDTDYEGGSQEHNNMPPYLAVYMWKRVEDPEEETNSDDIDSGDSTSESTGSDGSDTGSSEDSTRPSPIE